MPLIKVQLPIELIVIIAEILYIQECFVELEYVMHTFPELNECFSYKIPTIVLVDDDQYKKFISFIHSRERPYGSRDLFIIKQQSIYYLDKSTRLESKCYMSLGSKRYQESILKEFSQLGSYVSLVENKKLRDKYCVKSHKSYKLVCETRATANGNCRYRSYSFRVGLFLKTFLKHINPRLLRFEAYSGKKDLYFEWDNLYRIYSSFIAEKYNRNDAGDDHFTNPLRKDCLIDTPKCCFEFVKDIHKLPSLYQYATVEQPNSLEWNRMASPFSSLEKWWTKTVLRRTHFITTYNDQKTAFFKGLDRAYVYKIISKTQHNLTNSFISINCARSRTRDGIAYFFVQNAYLFALSKVQRILNSNVSWDSQFPYYVDLYYSDFLIDRLQSADITAFVDPKAKVKHNRKCQENSSCSKMSNLEYLINNLLESIRQLDDLDDEVSDSGMSYETLSHDIITTVVKETRNSIKKESLSKEQPLKLRVFDNRTQRINSRAYNTYIEQWFRIQMGELW